MGQKPNQQQWCKQKFCFCACKFLSYHFCPQKMRCVLNIVARKSFVFTLCEVYGADYKCKKRLVVMTFKLKNRKVLQY